MKKSFLIEVEMEERWIDHFLSMLKLMESFGSIGHSGFIALYSDGDGDFRPKFKFNTNYKQTKAVRENVAIDRATVFDAG